MLLILASVQSLFPDSLLCSAGLVAAGLLGGSLLGQFRGGAEKREGVKTRGGQDQGQLPSPGGAGLAPPGGGGGKQGL